MTTKFIDEMKRREAECYEKARRCEEIGDMAGHHVYFGMFTAFFQARVEFNLQQFSPDAGAWDRPPARIGAGGPIPTEPDKEK